MRLKHDSRDKQFHQHFGQVATSDFPTDIDFDSAQYDDVQPIGDVKCTCYTTCDIAEDQENRVFDIQDLWNRIPQSAFGAEPREVLGEAVKNGLMPVGQTVRAKDWKSYWSAISGDKDYFDNLRSALMISQSPVGVATYWCAEWLNVPAFGVIPIGKTRMNGHMYSIEGWKQINGEPMLIVEAWIGRKLYMPRAVFNQAMSDYGCGAWVLSTNEIDEKRKLNILEKIRDACINLIIILKQLLKPDVPVEKPIEPKPTEVYNEVKEAIKPMKYNWSTQEKARHSVRVICDEEGLTVKDKNDLCGTVGGESGWKSIRSKNKNFDGTYDWGIAQINEKYWIGEGKLFPTTQYVLDNPEICVRWMCKQWKAGKKNWWYAYKNGSYRKYMNPVFDNNGKLK